MKKFFKPTNILVFVMLIVVITLSIVATVNSNSDVLAGTVNYMISPNLAQNAKIEGNISSKKSLIDNKNHTAGTFRTSNNAWLIVDLKEQKTFNSIILKEDGLNVKDFEIQVSSDNVEFKRIFASDKIEYHRLCTFDNTTARYVKIIINKAVENAKLKEIQIFNEPIVNRKDFRVTTYYATDWQSTIALDTTLTIEERKEKIYSLIDKYNMSQLDHLFMYCGVSYDANGNVFMTSIEESAKYEAGLKLLIDCFKEKTQRNVKTSFVISSSSNNPTINSAMDANKQAFITNLIAFANRLGMDGVDFDYEFPQSAYDYAVFDSFLIDLKARMLTEMNVKENAKLSCAFGTRDINYSTKAKEAIDYVNCMTYDIFDQDGQHSSFWGGWVQGAKYLESIGFKKEQIHLGLPFYGTQPDALMEQYIYCNLKDLDYYRNTYEVIDYIGKPTTAYFNSASMCRDKTAYALLAGYGGIMTWHATIDVEYSSEYSLWRAIYTAVDQFGGR